MSDQEPKLSEWEWCPNCGHDPFKAGDFCGHCKQRMPESSIVPEPTCAVCGLILKEPGVAYVALGGVWCDCSRPMPGPCEAPHECDKDEGCWCRQSMQGPFSEPELQVTFDPCYCDGGGSIAHHPSSKCTRIHTPPTAIDRGELMDLNEYQGEANTTAIYPESGTGSINAISYLAHGLTEEAGEVAGHIKRIMRDDGGSLTPDRRQAIIKELGDTLWYISQICEEINTDLAWVATVNIDKLSKRFSEDKIRGQGSDR